jgi:electron transport complex protein RnfA
MSNPGLLLQIVLGSALATNVVLGYFLGLCPFFGVSRKLPSAIGLGSAVTVVLFLSTMVCAAVDRLILNPFGLGYLRLLVYLLVIAVVATLLEMILRHSPRQMYEAIGSYIPVIGLNCVTVGMTLMLTAENPWTGNRYSLLESAVGSLSSGLGFALVVMLMAGIRERLEFARVPKALQGLPIALISAGLMAMAFYGFSAFTVAGAGR